MERPHVVAHSLWDGKDSCNGHFDVPCTVENTAFIANVKTSHDKALRALELLSEALEFYAAALEVKHDGVIPEKIINGGEYITLGTTAAEALEGVNKILEEK